MSEPQYVQPPASEHTRDAVKAFVAVLAICALLAAGFFIWRAAWYQVRPDTGVAVCKALAGGKKVANSANDKLTEKEYKEVREAFSGSRDEEIRRHGTALIDAFWQVSQIPEGKELAALAYIGALTSAYSGLTGACAKHGYTLPSMSDLSSEQE